MKHCLHSLCAALLWLAFPGTVHAGERAFLHLDNSAYDLGDTLRLAAYVMDTGTKKLTEKSRVLYVELLAPEGYVVERRQYELAAGRCAGDIALRPLLLSGLYEVRAYTRCMQNESRTNYFSQVFPIYGKDGMGRRMLLDRPLRKGVEWTGASCEGASASDGITVSYDEACVVPFGCVSVKVKGKPGQVLSVSVADKAAAVPPCTGGIKSFVSGVDAATATQPSEAFSPEEGITVHGYLEREEWKFLTSPRYKGVAGIRLFGTLRAASGETHGECVTDGDGRFDLKLASFEGDGVLSLLHEPLERENKTRLRIERPASPDVREYTALERTLLHTAPNVDARELVSPDPLWSRTVHSVATITHPARQMEAYYDSGIMSADWRGNRYESENFLMNYLIRNYPECNYSDLKNFQGVRCVELDGEYAGDNVVPQSSKGVIALPDIDIRGCKEIILRTDSAICDAYSFVRKPQKPSNSTPYHVPNYPVSDYSAYFNNKTLPTSTSLPDKPSMVVCLVPMTKEERLQGALGPVDHGRRVGVAGFSPVSAYASPCHSASHPATDTRRTLYWNPCVELDSQGEATLTFCNNGTCNALAVTAYGIDGEGRALEWRQ